MRRFLHPSPRGLSGRSGKSWCKRALERHEMCLRRGSTINTAILPDSGSWTIGAPRRSRGTRQELQRSRRAAFGLITHPTAQRRERGVLGHRHCWMMRKLALVFIRGVGTKGRGGEKENNPSHAGQQGGWERRWGPRWEPRWCGGGSESRRKTTGRICV